MVNEDYSVIHALEQHIHSCIKYHNYQEAIFAAERIFAENPNDEIIYLLATCYYLDKQPKKTKIFLLQQDSNDYRCRHLLAQCFMDIGVTPEAENALLGVGQETIKLSDIASFYKDAAPSVLLMLADIFKNTNRKKMAKACLKQCLELNPLFWTSYTGLIDLGENANPKEIFSVATELIVSNASINSEANLGKISYPKYLGKNYSSVEDQSVIREAISAGSDTNFSYSDSFSYSFNRTPIQNENDNSCTNKFKKPEKIFGVPREKRIKEFMPAVSTPLNHCKTRKNPVTPTRNFKPRNSRGMISPLSDNKSHLSSINGLNISHDNQLSVDFLGSGTPSNTERSINSQRSVHFKDDFSILDSRVKSVSSKPHYETESVKIHLRLLTVLGQCYKAFIRCKYEDVIVFLKRLPKSQTQTSLVNSWLASALIELNNRKEALEILSFISKGEPWQLYGMVTYSNELWKDNNKTQLLYLSNHISELDRETPEYWCILANTMSSNNENEVALRFLMRAIQVRPTYFYAYILLGHEYLNKEVFHKALVCYEKALLLNSNQYHSYCGMAMVFQHFNQFLDAHEALIEGLKINPNSCLMLTTLALVRTALPENFTPQSSLELLERACSINPKFELARFQKATLLCELGQHLESLEDLKLLESLGNKDRKLYNLMSINYNNLGNQIKAMFYRNLANEDHLKSSNNSSSYSFTIPSGGNSLMGNTFSMDGTINMSVISDTSSTRNSNDTIHGLSRSFSENSF